jgi:hypothetical protein
MTRWKSEKNSAEGEVPAVNDVALQSDEEGVAVFVQRGAHGGSSE